MARAADVVVVGGGAIGLAVAWRVADAGGSVLLADPSPGRGSSWAAAGMLAPVTEVEYGQRALLELNLASNRAWPSFAAAVEEASGLASGYEPSGMVLVARDRDDLEELAHLHGFMTELGLEVERLGSRDIRELEPGLAPGTRGGLLASGDHRVDNRALVKALLAACERAGVVQRRVRIRSITADRGQVTGVVADSGEHLQAGTVVVAAGAWSGEIDGLPSASVPVRPVKGQVVHLRGPSGSPLATRSVRGLEVYIVPRAGGRVVIGATVEERGFDTSVTAGAVLELLRRAYELLPGLTELEFVEVSAGLRPGSPDNAPLIGHGPLDGLVLATGHYRNGILLTPVTAEAVAEIIQRGRVPDVVAPFAPDRFVGAVG